MLIAISDWACNTSDYRHVLEKKKSFFFFSEQLLHGTDDTFELLNCYIGLCHTPT